MKNNRKRKKFNIPKIVFAITLLILILVFLLNLKPKPQPQNEIAKYENTASAYNIEIGTNKTQIDLGKVIAKDNSEVNVPKMSAGMIPIANDNGTWKIVDKNNWIDSYNYFDNKPAFMMLSNGYYKAEKEVGIDVSRQLASNNIGKNIESNQIGTIYMWIPRFAYTESEIVFLKQTSIIEVGKWVIPEVFNIETISQDNPLTLTGIWVEFNTYSSSRVSSMNAEDNTYGLIANARVSTISNEMIETLNILNSKYNLDYLENISNTSRTIIKIVDTNEIVPLNASAGVVGTKVYVDVSYTKYGIDKIIYERTGAILTDNKMELSKKGGYYVFIVVDNAGNTKKCDAGHEENPPELIGFNVDNTFLVTYSGEIAKGTAKEYTKQSIRDILADGYVVNENNCLVSGEIDERKVDNSRGKWYQYKEQKWANIVVRNAGNEAYFTWIPRYAYKLDSESQTSEILFIDTNNIVTRTEEPLDLTEYKIPEAFQVVEEDGTVRELSGFWTGKYLVSSFQNFGLSAQVYSGINKIRISNLTNNLVSNARYDLYVMQNGEEVYYAQNVKKSLYEFGESTNQRLDAGTYNVRIVVYDQDNNYRGEKTYSVDVYDQVANISNKPEEPVLTGFNEHTYYVLYDENGNEDSSIPISQTLTAEQKEKWYNYSQQKWANIVVRNEGNEAYFVWIPRYEYHAYDGYEQTDVNFIPVTQTEPSAYCKIPEAFQVEEEYGTIKQLPGFWTGKYLVSSFQTFGLSAQVYSGINKIRILNLTNNIISNARYDLYVMQNGEEVYYAQNVNKSLYEFSESTNQRLDAGTYDVRIVVYDERGYYRGEKTYSVDVYNPVVNISNEPEEPVLTGFSEHTYYVLYDENGNEDSSIPISQTLTAEQKEKWYNYSQQKWANIVVRNEGNEAYFVWIPRYEYHAYDGDQYADVNFIPVTQTEPSANCKIPEAFQVEEEDGTIKQLPGFWTGKYLVSSFQNFGLSAQVYSGINKIRISNLTNRIISNARYDLYVMQNGEEVYYAQNVNKSLYEFGESTNQRLDAGTYDVRIVVYDERGYYRGEKTYSVDVNDQVANISNKPEEPVLTGFVQDITYYVWYEEDGTEVNVPITQTLTAEQKEKWYNYAEQRWANIVVKNEAVNKVAYFVWIPRYEYRAYDGYEQTDVNFIPVTQTEPSNGCKIPDAFHVEEEDGTIKELPGFWTGKYLVSN